MDDLGVTRVPAKGGTEIELSLFDGDGYLSGVLPIHITTNESGEACFRLHTGSGAGKICVLAKVVENANPALKILPGTQVEFIVHPKLNGPDAAVEAPQLVTGWHETVNPAPGNMEYGWDKPPVGEIGPQPVGSLQVPLAEVL